MLEVTCGVTYLRAMEQQTPVALKRLIWIGHAEGVSYLLLLGIAMPLKYMWGMPQAVKITGTVHGVLFVLFVFALINAKMDAKLSMGKVYTRVFSFHYSLWHLFPGPYNGNNSKIIRIFLLATL